jgi:hypothetical protein
MNDLCMIYVWLCMIYVWLCMIYVWLCMIMYDLCMIYVWFIDLCKIMYDYVWFMYDLCMIYVWFMYDYVWLCMIDGLFITFDQLIHPTKLQSITIDVHLCTPCVKWPLHTYLHKRHCINFNNLTEDIQMPFGYVPLDLHISIKKRPK